MKIDDFKPLWLRKWRTQTNINQLEWDLSSDLWSKKLDVETFLCQSRKKISFSKINLLNLRKNLVGPWGSTQLGERSSKPVSRPKSDTRKVSRPSSPQNRPTCTCSTLPRASARTPPLEPNSSSRQLVAGGGEEGWILPPCQWKVGYSIDHGVKSDNEWGEEQCWSGHRERMLIATAGAIACYPSPCVRRYAFVGL